MLLTYHNSAKNSSNKSLQWVTQRKGVLLNRLLRPFFLVTSPAIFAMIGTAFFPVCFDLEALWNITTVF